MSTSSRPKALLFDVFGTVVDWRSTVTRHLSERASTNSKSDSVCTTLAAISWPDFAQAWRDSYLTFCRTRDPSTTFVSVDQHHYESLKQLLKEHELEALWDEKEVLEISRIWHFLHPWPDSSRGIEELSRLGFRTCTLSNGNVSLLEDLAMHAQLPFIHLFSAEHFGAYKPSPKTYLGAVEKLGLRPEECAMVAAHLGDLAKARECGLQTIYIQRPDEEAWTLEEVGTAKKEGWVDMWIGIGDKNVGGGILECCRQFES